LESDFKGNFLYDLDLTSLESGLVLGGVLGVLDHNLLGESMSFPAFCDLLKTFFSVAKATS